MCPSGHRAAQKPGEGQEGRGEGQEGRGGSGEEGVDMNSSQLSWRIPNHPLPQSNEIQGLTTLQRQRLPAKLFNEGNVVLSTLQSQQELID